VLLIPSVLASFLLINFLSWRFLYDLCTMLLFGVYLLDFPPSVEEREESSPLNRADSPIPTAILLAFDRALLLTADFLSFPLSPRTTISQ